MTNTLITIKTLQSHGHPTRTMADAAASFFQTHAAACDRSQSHTFSLIGTKSHVLENGCFQCLYMTHWATQGKDDAVVRGCRQMLRSRCCVAHAARHADLHPARTMSAARKPPTDTEEVLNKIDHRFIDILYEHVVDEDTRLRYEVHDSFLGLLDEQEEHQQLGGRRASMKKKMKKRRGIVRRFTRWVGNKVDQATEAVKKGAAKVRSWFVGAGKTIKGAAKDVMARANKAIEATRKKLELIFDALVGKPLAWLQEKLWNALLAWQKRAVDKGKRKFLESAEGKAWKHSIELKLRRHQARTKFEGDKKYRVSSKRPFYGHAKCEDPRYANNKVKPIEGIADLHEHALSYLSFGGGYVHGKINGTLKEALPQCKGNDGHHGSFLSGTPFHRWRLNGWHEDPKKAFLGWPRFDTSSHVSSHLDWIKRAATRKDKFKLRFLTITAVHNEKLCILYRLFGRMPKSFIEGWKQSGYKMEEICADVPNIERQLKAAHEMAAENKDWMGIARSGKECRALASSGKLCVQLSIEVGDLCRRKNDVDLLHAYHYEDETPAACVKRLSDLGVRIAFLTHLRNNRWSAASFSTEFITTVHQWMARMHSENERRDAEGIDDKAVDLRADRGLVANLFKNIHRLFDMSSVLRSVRRADEIFDGLLENLGAGRLLLRRRGLARRARIRTACRLAALGATLVGCTAIGSVLRSGVVRPGGSSVGGVSSGGGRRLLAAEHGTDGSTLFGPRPAAPPRAPSGSRSRWPAFEANPGSGDDPSCSDGWCCNFARSIVEIVFVV